MNAIREHNCMENDKVLDSRLCAGYWKRVRECQICGKRLYTVEVICPGEMPHGKQDGFIRLLVELASKRFEALNRLFDIEAKVLELLNTVIGEDKKDQ